MGRRAVIVLSSVLVLSIVPLGCGSGGKKGHGGDEAAKKGEQKGEAAKEKKQEARQDKKRKEAKVQGLTGQADDPASDCDPNYSGCVAPYPPDVDCPDVGGPVKVTGTDVHELDIEGDGSACEIE